MEDAADKGGDGANPNKDDNGDKAKEKDAEK